MNGIKQDLNNFYVIQKNNEGVGYIRISGDNEVSIAICPFFMNKGYAFLWNW